MRGEGGRGWGGLGCFDSMMERAGERDVCVALYISIEGNSWLIGMVRKNVIMSRHIHCLIIVGTVNQSNRQCIELNGSIQGEIDHFTRMKQYLY